MTAVVLLLLLVAAVPLLRLVLRHLLADPTVVLAAAAVLPLAAAAIVASRADDATGWQRGTGLVLAVAAATTAGSDVVRATFRVMRGELLPWRRHPRTAVDQPADAATGTTLRGGAWVGYLERAAISATLLAGWPEGMALALAVKGVGRYPELRGADSAQTHAPETFIIGTLASVLWAAACAGVPVLVGR